MKIDVLCIGHATYDLVFSVDHHPGEDEKCFASGYVGAGGGPAANAAVTVARLGGTSAFAGYLGGDLFGSLHMEELLSDGVLTDLVVRGEYPTPLSAITVKPGGQRTVVTYKGDTPALKPVQVDFSRIDPKAVLFDGHEPDISIPQAKEALARNIPTILDAGSVHRGTVELAPLCGYLLASEKFARDFSKEKDPLKAIRLLGKIAPVAVITLGDAGLLWTSGNAVGRLGVYPVGAVDTTGAGDIFHGAFAHRISRGDELITALRYASAAAALGCTKMGARPGIPKGGEVEEFLRKSPEVA